MTNKEIVDFNKSIAHYTGTDLLMLKELIDNKMIDDYDLKENFMLHDKIDSYLYVVYYVDNTNHLYCKGKDAYEEYISNHLAIRVARKTKDLFPTFEDLMIKE